MSGKGEIEKKLEDFVENSFKKFDLTKEGDVMDRNNTEELIKSLMKKYDPNLEAWDQKEFNRMFDLFEEDEGGDAD